MVSKKSVLFAAWIEETYGATLREVPQLLIDLELAARMAVHDLDTMGEITPKALHALARASKNLEAEYGKDKSG